MKNIKPPFDIIMVWYQNDWGLYGRRNEAIARTLIKNKDIRKILHFEIPLDIELLQSNLQSPDTEKNIAVNLQRMNLFNDKGIYVFTPHLLLSASEKFQREMLFQQITNAINKCELANILLWLYPPHLFSEVMFDLLKDQVNFIISDCVDDHRQYAKTTEERELIDKRYKKIVGASDLVFTVSQAMRDEMAQYNPRAFYIPNGIPSDIFNQKYNNCFPEKLADIKHPLIGYTGALSMRIDTDLIAYIANTKPQWNIVLIGALPHQDVQALFKMPNVHWLDAVPYRDIHQYINQFDACIMPHKITTMTENMNPLKLYEYLALGKPVVATDVAGIGMFAPDIKIAKDKITFVNAIEEELSSDNQLLQQKRKNRVRNSTWDNRVEEMLRLIMNTDKTNCRISDNSYYSFDRPEVRALVPDSATTILDIGCGAGLLGTALKKDKKRFVIGVEYEPQIANQARAVLDDVIVGNIEDKIDKFPSDYFDCIILSDVLEHLRNPQSVLKNLKNSLKDNGSIIASIPNVSHWSVLLPLLEGNWDYEDAGILDRTHLRFFTKNSILKIFSSAGLDIKEIKATSIGDQSNIIKSVFNKTSNRINISSISEEANAYQYILKAGKRMINPHLTSLVILTYNELEYTKKCVLSIRKHTREDYEIIFVDNGSTDGTVEWLKKQIRENKSYKLIDNKKNLGFARGCNQGIEAAQGEYILLLNNDVVVAEGWLTGLLSCLSSAPDAGIVGPMTNNISGIQQIIDDEYRTVDYLDKYAAKFREKYQHRRIPLRRIVGFCMLFRRSLVEQIGLLDESFGTGNFEDDDLCLRAELAGYKNYIAGDVFIHHFGSRSFIGNRIDYSAAMSGNRKVIDKKWTLSTQTEEGRKLSLLRATEIANEHYSQGKMDQAIETLINCIKLTPDAGEIYYSLMRMFMEGKRFAEAWAVMGNIPEAVKDEIKTLEYAGFIKEGLNLDDEAADFAGKILSLKDNYAPALNLQGILAYKKADREKAEGLFKKAIESDPGYGEAYTNLGVLYWGQEKKEEAFSFLQKGFILSPNIPDVSSLYYSVISSVGKFSEAEADFREAARLYPQNKNIAFLLIDILIQQGKLNDAINKIEDALALFGPDEGTLNAALAIREKVGPLRVDKAKPNTLSFCLIVKNEEKYLVKCLRSIRDIADEIIIVDTGSTDKTKDIAKVFGARIFDFPWTGDFSAARNHSLQQAEGNWIFVLDADEVLSTRDFPELNKIISRENKNAAAYTVTTRNYVEEPNLFGWTPNKYEYAEEAGLGWIPSVKVRLFTNRGNIYFSYPVHETLEDSIIKKNIPIKSCNIIVHHYGKLFGEAKKKGEEYYLLGRIKLEQNPDDCNHIRN